QLSTINYRLTPPFFPPSPSLWQRLALGSRIQLQQRNCSRFARDFSRRSTFSSSQRTGSRTTSLRFRAQDLFISTQLRACTLSQSPRHRRGRLHWLLSHPPAPRKNFLRAPCPGRRFFPPRFLKNLGLPRRFFRPQSCPAGFSWPPLETK